MARPKANPPRLIEIAFGLYALAVAFTVAAITALVVAGLSDRSRRIVVTRAGARLVARLVGVHITVHGELPPAPFVLVANHDSFIDAGVLFSCCTVPLAFLVGSAFEKKPFVGSFLAQIGAQFVSSSPLATRRRLSELAQLCNEKGLVIAVFPEGSLAEEPGLRAFHRGAFMMAIEANVPVVPVGLIDTRKVLAPHAWLARKGEVQVRIGEPIASEGTARSLAEKASAALSTLLQRSSTSS